MRKEESWFSKSKRSYFILQLPFTSFSKKIYLGKSDSKEMNISQNIHTDKEKCQCQQECPFLRLSNQNNDELIEIKTRGCKRRFKLNGMYLPDYGIQSKQWKNKPPRMGVLKVPIWHMQSQKAQIGGSSELLYGMEKSVFHEMIVPCF